MSKAVVLAARPEGAPRESDFELRELPDAEPGDGDVLVRNVLVSVDPYMRGRMTGIRTYVGPFEIGDVIDGGAVGRVAFDYRETPAKDALADGIDVYFDNVGGDQLESALFALRPFGRVIACGAISRYNSTDPEPGPRNLAFVVSKRLRIQGFIVTDHFERFGAFLAEVGPWVAEGALQHRETIVDGLENAPAAFAGLFRGDNVGKMLVRVGPD